MATSTASRRKARTPKNKWIIVRHSPVHGYGCFARKHIPKGTRIIEYTGDRISHKAADKRYEDADPGDNHTFLFIADRRTVIDATYGGNESRFINHSCDGNCTSQIEKGRVFIDATRDIARGEELGYDYQIPRDKDDPPNVDRIYACRCGAEACRGTMLWPPKRKKAVKRKAARKVARKVATKAGARR
jgi:SET domain-containing protein